MEGGKKPKQMKELVQSKRIEQGESGELPPAQKLPEGGIAGISPKTLEPCASSCNPVLHAAWNARQAVTTTHAMTGGHGHDGVRRDTMPHGMHDRL